MKTIIKHILYIACALSIIPLVAQTSKKETFKGYRLTPYQISPDGKWIIYSKINLEEDSAKNTDFINTQTKKQVPLERNSAFYKHLLNDGITLKHTSDTLSIINLETSQTQKEMPNIIQFDSDKKNNYLFTLSNEGALIIYQLTSINQLEKFRQNNISIFFLNPDKTTLVYQDNSSSKNLFYLDLKTLKETKICSLKQNITTLKWNLTQDAVLFDGEYNNSMFIHLPTLKVKQITLPKESINEKKIDFYSNNDLLITYNITTDQKDPESEYLDIWQGNSKQIIPSQFKPRYKINYDTKIYKFDTGEYIKLESGRNIRYLPISIPGYVLHYDPLEKEDFLNTYIKNTYIIKNVKTGEQTTLSSFTQNPLMISPDNKHLLYPKEDGVNWEVFTPDTNKRIEIESDNLNLQTPLWSVDSKYVYFIKNNNLHKIDIATNKSFQLTNFSKDTEIIIRSLVSSPSNISLIDNKKPVIIQITRNNQNAIYKIDNTKVSTILPFTSNRIDRKMLLDPTFNTIVWMEENYNMPHKVNIYKNKKVTTLIENEIPKDNYSWQKRKDITFKNKYGKELEGFLFYPKNFDPKKSYPMVTHIYEEIWRSAGLQPNRFIQSTLRNAAGHNRTLLNEEGYFVFYPDTFVTIKDGPGISAVDCVERAIEKILEEEPSINKNKIGLDGFSFGGYKAGFIASHSNTFAAIISGAGSHDIINEYYRYNLKFRRQPGYTILESGQFGFIESLKENPQKYITNSSILFAQHIKTPILLVTGLKDLNVFWENTSSLFWALKRYNKTQVVALFYKDGEHGFYFSPKIYKDYTKRYMDWYNYYLKGEKSIQWIENSVNPDKISYSF